MRRNTVRLTESQLHRIIKESVKKVLKEGPWNPYDEKYKDFQNDHSWGADKLDSYDPFTDAEKTAYSRKPTQSNGNVNIYGNARDENWNVQDTHGMNAMNAMSDNPYSRYQGQHMGSTLKQSVDNGVLDLSKVHESKKKSARKKINESYDDESLWQMVKQAVTEKLDGDQNIWVMDDGEELYVENRDTNEGIVVKFGYASSDFHD